MASGPWGATCLIPPFGGGDDDEARGDASRTDKLPTYPGLHHVISVRGSGKEGNGRKASIQVRARTGARAGREAAPLEPAAIVERALLGSDPLCVETLDTFCGMLGTAAGNLAITLGAQGGVYIGGGIVPLISTALVPLFGSLAIGALLAAVSALSLACTLALPQTDADSLAAQDAQLATV